MRTREQSPDACSESGIMQPSTVPQIIVSRTKNGVLRGVAVNPATKALRREITENRCFLKIPERDNKNKQQTDGHAFRHVLC